jgi:hypothetical protein
LLRPPSRGGGHPAQRRRLSQRPRHLRQSDLREGASKRERLREACERKDLVWNCTICGEKHGDVPACFGIDAPWRALVPEDEFDRRVELTADQCVIDDNTFFVRGHIEIPIHGNLDPLAFSVWSSLSKQSFLHMTERWNAADRANDDLYFGWLSTPIWVYPDTIHLKLAVQSRRTGLTPLFEVRNDKHDLARDQRDGISIERWHRLALQLLG